LLAQAFPNLTGAQIVDLLLRSARDVGAAGTDPVYGRGVLDIGEFDTSSDAAFVERLYMPGLRRAGDLSTAAALVEDRAVIHNAGPSFVLNGAPAPREKMSAKDIVTLLKSETK